MRKNAKKVTALFVSGLLLMNLAACGTKASADNQQAAGNATKAPVSSQQAENNVTKASVSNEKSTGAESTENNEMKTPKYVFMFIGDGMSYPQIQSTADYLGALTDEDYFMAQPSLDDNKGAILDGPQYLNFMNFAAAGSAITYDSNSFAPDSASTATSLSTGKKTYSGTINMDETGTTAYETITEKVHKQLGMKVGIISSVNLNHATPAAYYAHQASRNSYYEIGVELVKSGFEYFAGGGLKKVTGYDAENPEKNLYEMASENGYKVVMTQAEAEQVSAADGKVIIIDENLADSAAMAYELDRTADMWSLADYVAKGIEVLDNDKGFFMMCEGGKIDWACHANDAASTISDTVALANAVQVAVDFAKNHAEETLIIVTGDHETGGLTIGFAGTDYDTYLTLLQSQKISFAKYDSDYVAAYKANKTSFEDV
ncbi:MAG: alkaline phosphatase, partial [Lachnospiraceae bacterium]